MDADLAYCLERFIDDQVQMIDDYMETVREEEAAERHRIEQKKKSYMLRNTNRINAGSHEIDEAIVQRFVQRLHDSTNTNSTAVDSDAENYRQILRDELYEKMDKCANHIIRLRNLAVPIRGSDDFIWQCDNIIDRFDQEQNTDESFKQLYQIIEQSDCKSLIKNVQNWWEKSYGSYVTEIIHFNKKFNPRVADNNIAVVSSWSRFIRCAKQVHSTRSAEIPADSRKNELVREFVREIQSVDNENRQEISEDNLVKQLDSSDISTNVDYAEKWLNKRDNNRNQKKEDDTCM